MTQSSSSNPFRVEVQPPRPVPARPAWVPPAGYFADVPMKNMPSQLAPSIYGAGDMYTAFEFWTGSAVLYDFSPLGAQVFQGAGHESSLAAPNIQMTVALDFSTLMWSVQNVPVAANAANSFDANQGTAPDGTPYNGHTYLGLQEMPNAWGGGPKGTLVQMLTAGSVYRQTIHLADVSKPVHGYSELPLSGQTGASTGNNQIKFSANSVGGNYPLSVQDNGRQGWWLDVGGGHDYTLFISKSGAVTQYPALNGNNYYSSLVLCESKNLLMLFDGGTATAARSMRICDLTTGTTKAVDLMGPLPSAILQADGTIQYRPEVLGLQWVEELGCVVGLDAWTTPPSICKITPPAANAATTAWTISTVNLNHWSAGDSTGSATIRTAKNGNFSKFRWVKTLGAFVLATSPNTNPQVFSL